MDFGNLFLLEEMINKLDSITPEFIEGIYDTWSDETKKYIQNKI